jgi:fatty-acyl-CoA synthase
VHQARRVLDASAGKPDRPASVSVDEIEILVSEGLAEVELQIGRPRYREAHPDTRLVDSSPSAPSPGERREVKPGEAVSEPQMVGEIRTESVVRHPVLDGRPINRLAVATGNRRQGEELAKREIADGMVEFLNGRVHDTMHHLVVGGGQPSAAARDPDLDALRMPQRIGHQRPNRRAADRHVQVDGARHPTLEELVLPEHPGVVTGALPVANFGERRRRRAELERSDEEIEIGHGSRPHRGVRRAGDLGRALQKGRHDSDVVEGTHSVGEAVPEAQVADQGRPMPFTDLLGERARYLIPDGPNRGPEHRVDPQLVSNGQRMLPIDRPRPIATAPGAGQSLAGERRAEEVEASKAPPRSEDHRRLHGTRGPSPVHSGATRSPPCRRYSPRVFDGGPVSLGDLLRRRADQHPTRTAFAYRTQQLTFAGLAERAAARAAAMASRGVLTGDRVGMAMSPGLGLVEVFWALQLLGASPCIVNPSVPSETLSKRLAMIRPRLVVTDEVAGELQRSSGPLPEGEQRSEDVAFLQLTSGTSGAPRASVILQRNVMAYLRTSRSGGFFRSEDVFVSWVPPWHDLGLVRFIVSPVYHGITCHLVEPAVRTIPEWLETIDRARGTYSAAPDFALRLAVRMVDAAKVDLSSLRLMKSGGEPARQSTIDAFEARFAVPGVVVPGYGLGEATLGVSEHLPHEPVGIDERGNVSCGLPNPGLQTRAGVSADAPAEILVRGDTVFAGYFDAPDETRHALRDGWLHTGDIGYHDGAGRLFVLGRREGMIKRAGAIVAPRELEEAAQRAPSVRVAAAVTLITDGSPDAVVVAVEADLDGTRSAEEIQVGVSRAIVAAVGFAPARVVVLPRRSIPRTENGKIRHAELRRLLEGMGR